MPEDFNSAFWAARRRGQMEFRWRGRSYHTRKESETIAKWRENMAEAREVPDLTRNPRTSAQDGRQTDPTATDTDRA